MECITFLGGLMQGLMVIQGCQFFALVQETTDQTQC